MCFGIAVITLYFDGDDYALNFFAFQMRYFKYTSGYEELETYADFNWDEDCTDRKSNSVYFIRYDGYTIAPCCRKQQLVAQESAQSARRRPKRRTVRTR